jgi:signal transduction histidine kinase
LFVFTLLVLLVGGYFFRQTRQASRELQTHSRDHAKILAAVVELNIRNALLAKSGLEDIVASSLKNSSRFIYYLNSIEPFSSEELTAFALESGFAGLKIEPSGGGAVVSGPSGWLPERSCARATGLAHLEEKNLYLFSFLSARAETGEAGCVLVGVSADKIDATIDKISVSRLLSILNSFHDIAYVRIDPAASAAHETNGERSFDLTENVIKTMLPMGESQLVVALKTARFAKRRQQMENEFLIFISFLILFGVFSSWWLYRIQQQRLQEARNFERKMARQHEDAALGRAAATITHELRNPLNAIGMGLQRLELEAKAMDEDHHGLIKSMRTAVVRTDGIVARLGQYAQAFDVAREPVNLTKIINQLLVLYRPQCEKQKITVTRACEQVCVVAGDETLLGQLFENLVKNSVEAQKDGGFLQVSVRETGKSCQVEIRNGGCVLSSEESKLLFEPYFTTKSQGTGLGLVMSRKIVQAHSGSLECRVLSEKQQISFQVILPKMCKELC